jgi:putative ABC transport system permease protein
MVRGVEALNNTDLGIDPDNLLTAQIALFPAQFPNGTDALAFTEKLTTVLSHEQEIVSVSAGTTLPGFMGSTERVDPEGYERGASQAPVVRYGSVDAHFAQTYEIELRAGRLFDSRDTADSAPVVIIDQRFADSLFPGSDPIGRRVRIPADSDDGRWHVVIGVIENLQLEDVGDTLYPTMLIALPQHPARFISIAMRTRGDPDAFKTRFLEVLRAQDANTPAYGLRSYEEVLRVAMVGERVISGMFSAFGMMALVLAAAGLYGLIAQLVGQRTQEIGVQRALGASSFAVLRGLLSQTLKQVGMGLLIGIAMAVPFARKMGEALTELPEDPLAIPILVAILLTVAVIATLMPARRALAVDPTVALRHD